MLKFRISKKMHAYTLDPKKLHKRGFISYRYTRSLVLDDTKKSISYLFKSTSSEFHGKIGFC
jgi:hypothetical protein